MRKQRSGSVWMILPLYIFTLIFVAGPLLYVLALSFAKPAPTHGIEWTFSWDNYRKILEPVYLSTFAGSFRLAVTSTFFICLIRLYGCMIILQTKGVLNHVLKTLGIIEKPLRILYSYPAIVVGMIYVLLPFMILSVYSSAEKLDWSLVEAARDLGASPFKAFWTVSFKLTLPGLLSGVILTFIPSMGLFFIADILGGNKIVLVGSLIQEQMTRGNNWPFAAALAVVLMVLTTLMILLYRKITNAKELEGIG